MIEIRRLTPEDAEAAGRVSGLAIRDDPIYRHALPETALRHAAAHALETAAMTGAALAGSGWAAIDVERGHLVGVAWTATANAPELAVSPSAFAGALPRELAERLAGIFSAMHAVTDRVAPPPALHLELMGVDPDWQGRGIGTLLLQRALREAAEAGLPLRLDTFQPRNVPFYERNGMDCVARGVEIEAGLPLWVFRSYVARSGHLPRLPSGSVNAT